MQPLCFLIQTENTENRSVWKNTHTVELEQGKTEMTEQRNAKSVNTKCTEECIQTRGKIK